MFLLVIPSLCPPICSSSSDFVFYDIGTFQKYLSRVLCLTLSLYIWCFLLIRLNLHVFENSTTGIVCPLICHIREDIFSVSQHWWRKPWSLRSHTTWSFDQLRWCLLFFSAFIIFLFCSQYVVWKRHLETEEKKFYQSMIFGCSSFGL